MRHYEITIPLKGTVTKRVVAASEDEAKEKALSAWAENKYKNLDYLEPDEHSSEGNCIEGDKCSEEEQPA